MRKPLRITRDQRGFTLTELLVACALIGLVMAGLFSMLQSGQQTYLTGTNQVEAQQALRLALLRMTNEIRDAGLLPDLWDGQSGARQLRRHHRPVGDHLHGPERLERHLERHHRDLHGRHGAARGAQYGWNDHHDQPW